MTAFSAGLYGGDDEAAAKAAGHELRGLQVRVVCMYSSTLFSNMFITRACSASASSSSLVTACMFTVSSLLSRRTLTAMCLDCHCR